MVKVGNREFRDGFSVGEFKGIMTENIELLKAGGETEQATTLQMMIDSLQEKVNFLNDRMMAGEKFTDETAIKEVNEVYQDFLAASVGSV